VSDEAERRASVATGEGPGAGFAGSFWGWSPPSRIDLVFQDRQGRRGAAPPRVAP